MFTTYIIYISSFSLNCARQLGDQDFLREYGHIDFVGKEVMCHKTCRLMYNRKKILLVNEKRRCKDG